MDGTAGGAASAESLIVMALPRVPVESHGVSCRSVDESKLQIEVHSAPSPLLINGKVLAARTSSFKRGGAQPYPTD